MTFSLEKHATTSILLTSENASLKIWS